MNHTTSTWRYAPELSAVVTIADQKVKTIADFGAVDISEREANAALIAAAPDLLAALEAMITASEIIDGQDSPPAEDDVEHLHSMIKAARAAIAKAKQT